MLRRGLGFVVARRRAIATTLAVLVAAAVAFRAARLSAGYWTIDDAGITYAAAFELVDHGSVAAYVEGPPVESYSNPLVYFAVAGLRALGAFDPIVTPLRLEMLVFAVMVALVWAMLRRRAGELAAVLGAALFATLQLAATPTWIWYGSGLENVWVAAGLVALIWSSARTLGGVALAPGWGVLAFAVAITRPEAPVYVAGYYLALALCARPPALTWRAHLGRVAGAAAVTAALYAGFLAWRRLAYGDWLPNTYYAKLTREPDLGHNLRVAVGTGILLYARTWLVASSAVALAAIAGYRRLAAVLGVFLVAALALPITAGEDWGLGGGHRFATPFLTVAHTAFATLAAACLAAAWRARRRGARVAAIVGLVALAWLTERLVAARLARGRPKLNDVTLPFIAAGQGAERWEHQLRLGLPYAVTMIPDAGGSLLVGAMQMVDNAYLADFAMAHMGRYFGADPPLLRQTNQYQHEERRPDLVDGDPAIGVIDPAYLGTRYLAGPSRLRARRDLVEVAALDPGARLVLEDSHVRIYLSDETVLIAAPGALVRCELIVAWTHGPPDDHVRLRGAVAGGDRDEIALGPYQPAAAGIERRALLLGAPDHAGPAAVTLALVRDDRVVAEAGDLALDVHADDAAVAGAADAILAEPSVMRAARRLAWLREQRIARLGMTRFHRVVDELRARDRAHGSRAGADLLALRWTARLAGLEPVAPAIAAAELVIARRLLATCPAAPGPRHLACAGRAIDELRRLGYLGLVARLPELGDDLARARQGRAERDALAPDDRYQALVGLVLADPSRIAIQRELIALRRTIERYPALPGVSDRAAE